MEIDLSKFEQSVGVVFNEKKILDTVFTHRSYLNEHKSLKIEHNERLEFLGDAVLELAVTQYLYNKFDRPEGEMTNWRSALVKGESLSTEAKRLGMDDYIRTSRGESKNTGKARDLILANAFEALIGGIYIDQGFEKASEFIIKNVVYKIEDIISNQTYYDAKSKFQEKSQERFGITPTYESVSETGPDHNKIFLVAVYLGKKKIAEGEGSSKQRAQLDAAANALKVWDDISL